MFWGCNITKQLILKDYFRLTPLQKGLTRFPIIGFVLQNEGRLLITFAARET